MSIDKHIQIFVLYFDTSAFARLRSMTHLGHKKNCEDVSEKEDASDDDIRGIRCRRLHDGGSYITQQDNMSSRIRRRPA